VRTGLKIFQRIAAGIQDISFHVHPKSEYHVNNDWRAHREKGNIDKPHTYAAGSNANSFANGGTNPESIPFYEILQPVHTAKL
jgi:hypothetical protein